jgi:hypothetical protein
LCGVEDGSQCFCSQFFFGQNITKVPLSDCSRMECSGNASENCGGANRILVFKSHCSSVSPVTNPSQSQCQDPKFSPLQFCDPQASVESRIADLVQRMTTAEKIGMMGQGGSEAIPRLGVAGTVTTANIECTHTHTSITHVTHLHYHTQSIHEAHKAEAKHSQSTRKA